MEVVIIDCGPVDVGARKLLAAAGAVVPVFVAGLRALC